MHEVFKGLGRELGGSIHTDEVGNTYVANTDEMGYTLIGSHLDSVIDGGRYDGVAGVIAGLMVMKWAKEDGLRIPLRVGAFRCEESSNFGCCTIGSGLWGVIWNSISSRERSSRNIRRRSGSSARSRDRSGTGCF